MEKTIKLNGKDLKIKSSAFTPFAYKNLTGSSLLKDLNKINKVNNEISKLKTEEEKNERWMDELDNILELSLKIVYVLANEADKSIPDYDTWVSSMDDIMSDTDWISAAFECAISPISGQLQKD